MCSDLKSFLLVSLLIHCFIGFFASMRRKNTRLSYSPLCLVILSKKPDSRYQTSTHINRKVYSQKWLIAGLDDMMCLNHFEVNTQIW